MIRGDARVYGLRQRGGRHSVPAGRRAAQRAIDGRRAAQQEDQKDQDMVVVVVIQEEEIWIFFAESCA